MKQLSNEFLSKEFIRCLMLIHDDVGFDISERDTVWQHRACVFVSAIDGADRVEAFRNLSRQNKSVCVLTHGDNSLAARMHPECAELAYGKIPRIFDTLEEWNVEKIEIFSHYKYVIVLDPDMQDPLLHLENRMLQNISAVRDTTRFIVQNS